MNFRNQTGSCVLFEGFRYRCLETGVFITRDPLGFVDGPNLYTYVLQNPWTYFDPEGLFRDTEYAATISIGFGFDTQRRALPRIDLTVSAQNELSESARATVDVNLSLYGGEQGTPNDQYGVGGDFSVLAYFMSGSGSGDSLPIQTLNRNTHSAMENDFARSWMWGGGYNYNNATEDWTSHYVGAVRHGDTLVSFQNDQGRFPAFFWPRGTDQAWTASFDVKRGVGSGDFAQIGWQGFTGVPDFDVVRNNIYDQPRGDVNLNRSVFYLGGRQGNFSHSIGYSGPRTDWPQRGIHSLWDGAANFRRTETPRLSTQHGVQARW